MQLSFNRWVLLNNRDITLRRIVFPKVHNYFLVCWFVHIILFLISYWYHFNHYYYNLLFLPFKRHIEKRNCSVIWNNIALIIPIHSVSYFHGNSVFVRLFCLLKITLVYLEKPCLGSIGMILTMRWICTLRIRRSHRMYCSVQISLLFPRALRRTVSDAFQKSKKGMTEQIKREMEAKDRTDPLYMEPILFRYISTDIQNKLITDLYVYTLQIPLYRS